MKRIKKDNTTYLKKVHLRRSALSTVEDPIVMETNGGEGKIFERVYSHIISGVVFEKDPRKSTILGKQRPTWSVFECDCVGALSSNVGNHLDVNFLDIDPYGDPWKIVSAFLESDRNLPKILNIVVNDGLRQKAQLGGAWKASSLTSVVERFGNNIYGKYLDVCQFIMNEKASQHSYRMTRWHGYYCGYGNNMTHYWAVLEKD